MSRFSAEEFRTKLARKGYKLPGVICGIFSEATDGRVSAEDLLRSYDGVFESRFEQFKSNLAESSHSASVKIDERPWSQLREYTGQLSPADVQDRIFSAVGLAIESEAASFGLDGTTVFGNSMYFEDYCYSVAEQTGFNVSGGQRGKRPTCMKSQAASGATAKIRFGRGMRLPYSLPLQLTSFMEMSLGRKKSSDFDWQVFPFQLVPMFQYYGAHNQAKENSPMVLSLQEPARYAPEAFLSIKLGISAHLAFLCQALEEIG